MKKILLLLVVILLLPPKALAVVGGGGGGNPVTSCANYSFRDTDHIFQDYHDYSYVGGLLQIHFKLQNDIIKQDNYYPFIDLYNFDDDCSHYGNDFFDSNNLPILKFPEHTINFSLRFISAAHFVIWNDDQNIKFDCSACDIDFSSYNYPEKLQVAFSVGDYFGYNYIASEAVPIIDPNIVQGETKILIIPGIMGTNIEKGDETLWISVGRLLRSSSDDFLDPLSFKEDSSPLDTSLKIGEVISSAGTLDYSSKLVNDLQNYGYTVNRNLFLFAYDWRKDLDYIASQDDPDDPTISLKKQIDQILAEGGNVSIIAHSQGGLVVKRLLYDYPEYQNKIKKLIFVGVPNLGAPKAAKVLLYGDPMGASFLVFGLNSNEVKKISQNMPSVYELLPSEEYFDSHGSYLSQQQAVISDPKNPSPDYYTAYNFSQAKQVLKNKGLNASLIDKADDFHNSDYDNMDFSDSSMQTYNIVGCQTATYDKIMMPLNRDPFILTTAGDGTVPFDSAKNIPGAMTYYALDANHATMMTDDGTRQLIENLLTGSTQNTQGKITPYENECHYNSTIVSVHSPVDLHVYDEQGNHVGPNVDGNVDINISGAQYDVVGHGKYAFLPPGHDYTVKLIATGSGTFDLYSTKIQDGITNSTAYYSFVPVTASSTAEMQLDASNNQSIQLDEDGDGVAEMVIAPSSVLGASESLDVIPPVSTSTLSGVLEGGMYEGGVKVELNADDIAAPGHEDEASGVLGIRYSLDGGDFSDYSTDTPLTVSGAGSHTLDFFATDRAGNNENAQTVEFSIAGASGQEPGQPAAPAASGGSSYSSVAGPSIIINNGATSTASSTVELSFSAPGMSQVQVSNAPDFAEAEWQAIPAALPWNLESGSGLKTVYARFRVAPASPAVAASAGILLRGPEEAGQVLGAETPLEQHVAGSLIIGVGDSTTVYLVENGIKHPFSSARNFLSMGYAFASVAAAWPGDELLLLGTQL